MNLWNGHSSYLSEQIARILGIELYFRGGAYVLLESTSTWMVNMGGINDSNRLVAIRDVDDSLWSLTIWPISNDFGRRSMPSPGPSP